MRMSASIAAPASMTLEEAQLLARDVVNRSGSSFTVAMKLMSKQRRQAMYAVYAFARAVDDIADDEGVPVEKCAALAEWRQEIARVYAGAPQSAIGMALLGPIKEFRLPRQEFELLVEGMEMDANGPIQAPPLETLLAYTRRAAGTVGMLSMPIFGAPAGPASDQFALALADGLQLTNILRDVREDAGIDRLYLPREFLLANGLTDHAPEAVASHPNVALVCADLGKLARERFGDARQAMASLKTSHIRPALMMMGVYEGYLDQLEARNWAMTGPEVSMGKGEKLARSLRYALWPPRR